MARNKSKGNKCSPSQYPHLHKKKQTSANSVESEKGACSIGNHTSNNLKTIRASFKVNPLIDHNYSLPLKTYPNSKEKKMLKSALINKSQESSLKMKIAKLKNCILDQDLFTVKYTCSKCDFKTAVKETFHIHELIHKQKFCCQNCSFVTHAESILNNHMLSHIDRTPAISIALKNKSAVSVKKVEISDGLAKCLWKNLEPNKVKTMQWRNGILNHTQKEKNTTLDKDQLIIKYMCSKCDFMTATKEMLDIHELTHNQKFSCQNCDFVTHVESVLNKHMFSHVGKTPAMPIASKTKSEVSIKKVEKSDNVAKYLWKNLGPNEVKAMKWKGKILNHTEKEKHSNLDQDQIIIKYICSKCDFMTATKETLDSHELTHNQKFYCQKCDFVTHIESVLDNHKFSHVDKTSAMPIILKNKSGVSVKKVERSDRLAKTYEVEAMKWISRIFYQTEKEKNLPSGQVQPVIKYACSKCDFMTAAKEVFHTHELTHNQKFYCQDCDFVTHVQSVLNNHMFSHLAKTPTIPIDVKNKSALFQYQCDSCNYKTDTISSLIFHEMEHTGEKTYHCYACRFVTINRTRLIRHQSQHKDYDV